MSKSIPKLFLTVRTHLLTLRALDMLTVHAQEFSQRNFVPATGVCEFFA